MSADPASPLPRTLIVSEAPFGMTNGFGVTLNTFFAGWPTDRVQLFHTRPASEPTVGASRTTFADVPGSWGRRFGLEFALGRRPTWRGRYSPAWLRRTLDGWRPEVVYALVFSGETLAFASWIAGRIGCPFVPHVADDGLETQRAGVRVAVGDLFARSAARISISEEMRQEFAARYGADSTVLHNGAADELLQPPLRDAGSGDTFVVRYLGSIVPSHHFNAIEDIAAAVRRLADDGLNVRFELCGAPWTRAHADALVDGTAVVYRGEVSRHQGFDLLKTADLLVVPVSFDAAALVKNRLSLPTKLAECLASGTPTVVYGPDGSAPVEFCRRHGVGSIVTTRSAERIAAIIRDVQADRTTARLRADEDRRFVREHYSASLVREQFQRILRGAASASS